MRLSFYGPNGCNSILSRHIGKLPICPFLCSEENSKILTVVFLSDEVKSDSCLFIKNVFQIFYHFITQINVREKMTSWYMPLVFPHQNAHKSRLLIHSHQYFNWKKWAEPSPGAFFPQESEEFVEFLLNLNLQNH